VGQYAVGVNSGNAFSTGKGAALLATSLVYLLIAGCYKYLSENYDRPQFSIQQPWQVTLDLSGTDIIRGQKGFRGAPYELSIIVSAPGEIRGQLIVFDIELVPTGSSNHTVTVNGVYTKALRKLVHAPSIESITIESIAGVSVKDLDIPYLDYRLRCQIEIRTESGTVHERIDRPFTRMPEERRWNKWVDAFLSV
jgi:hypothetical protein